MVKERIQRLQVLASDARSRLSRVLLLKSQPEQPRLRLSQLGNCPVFVVKSILTGVSPDLSAAAGILSAGELFENFVYQAYDGEEVIRQFEVELDGIRGHIDFYFPQHKFLIECKTIATHRVASDMLPMEQHLIQVHAYLAALKEMTGGEHDALLIYIPRENPHPDYIRVFPLTYDESMHSEISLRIALLKHAIETGQIPPIPAEYQSHSYPCLWYSKISRMQWRCPFWSDCWASEAKQMTKEKSPLDEKLDEEDFPTQEMDPELEQLAELLFDLRSQGKELENQIKAVRAEILKVAKKGRFIGRHYTLVVKTEERKQLDRKKLAEAISNLEEFMTVSRATIVDVAKIS